MDDVKLAEIEARLEKSTRQTKWQVAQDARDLLLEVRYLRGVLADVNEESGAFRQGRKVGHCEGMAKAATEALVHASGMRAAGHKLEGLAVQSVGHLLRAMAEVERERVNT